MSARPGPRRFSRSTIATGAVVLSVTMSLLVACDGERVEVSTGDAEPAVDAAPDDTGWTRAAPGYAWQFPEDHHAHPEYRIEWWYLTGNLTADDGSARGFGYQLTLFRVGLRPPAVTDPGDADPDPAPADPARGTSRWEADALVMGHLAVTDVAGQRHHFRSVLHRAGGLLGGFEAPPDPRLAWCVGPAGTRDPWEIRWNGDAFDLQATDDARGFGVRLTTRPGKERILQGPDGYSPKTSDGTSASLYTSFTRLVTEGTVIVDGEPVAVRGTSWMDQEFSTSQLGDDQIGWDWFGLHLDDGRELMLFRLRNADGTSDVMHATLVDRAGDTTYLDADAITIDPGQTWTSPGSGATYPVTWRLRVAPPGKTPITLDVRSRVADQENLEPGVFGPTYYEGAVELRDPDGRVVGRGYMELTGYGPDGRPPL